MFGLGSLGKKRTIPNLRSNRNNIPSGAAPLGKIKIQPGSLSATCGTGTTAGRAALENLPRPCGLDAGQLDASLRGELVVLHHPVVPLSGAYSSVTAAHLEVHGMPTVWSAQPTVADYEQLRGTIGTRDAIVRVQSTSQPEIDGTFAFAEDDPYRNGDDGGLVLKTANGWWVRQFDHSLADPIRLDWFRLADGADITDLLSRLCQTFSPSLYLLAPSIKKTLTSGKVSFRSLRQFYFSETDAALTIKQKSVQIHSLDSGRDWIKLSGDVWRTSAISDRVYNVWSEETAGSGRATLLHWSEPCKGSDDNLKKPLQWWSSGLPKPSLHVRMQPGEDPNRYLFQVAYDDMLLLWEFDDCVDFHLGGPKHNITFFGLRRTDLPDDRSRYSDAATYDARKRDSNNTLRHDTTKLRAMFVFQTGAMPEKISLSRHAFHCNIIDSFYIGTGVITNRDYPVAHISGKFEASGVYYNRRFDTVRLDNPTITDPAGYTVGVGHDGKRSPLRVWDRGVGLEIIYAKQLIGSVTCRSGGASLSPWAQWWGETTRLLDGMVWRQDSDGLWSLDLMQEVGELLADNEELPRRDVPSGDSEWTCRPASGGAWRLMVRSNQDPTQRFSRIVAVHTRLQLKYANLGFLRSGVRIDPRLGNTGVKYDAQAASTDPEYGRRMITIQVLEDGEDVLGAGWGRVFALESTTESSETVASLTERREWADRTTRGAPPGLPADAYWIDLSAIEGNLYKGGKRAGSQPLSQFGDIKAVKFNSLQIVDGADSPSDLSSAKTRLRSTPPTKAFHYDSTSAILSIYPEFEDLDGNPVRFTPGPGCPVEIVVAINGYGANVEADIRAVNLYGPAANLALNVLERHRLQDAVQFVNVRGPQGGGDAMKASRGEPRVEMPPWSTLHGDSAGVPCRWHDLRATARDGKEVRTEPFALGVDGLLVKGGEWTGRLDVNVGQHRRFEGMTFIDWEGPYLRPIARIGTKPGYSSDLPFVDLTVARAGYVIEDDGTTGTANVSITGSLTVGDRSRQAPGRIDTLPHYVGGIPEPDPAPFSPLPKLSWDLCYYSAAGASDGKRITDLGPNGRDMYINGVEIKPDPLRGNVMLMTSEDAYGWQYDTPTQGLNENDDIMIMASVKPAAPCNGRLGEWWDGNKRRTGLELIQGGRRIKLNIGGTFRYTLESIDLSGWLYDGEWHEIIGIVSRTTNRAVVMLDGHVIAFTKRFESLPRISETTTGRCTYFGRYGYVGLMDAIRISKAVPFIPTAETFGLWRLRGNYRDATGTHGDLIPAHDPVWIQGVFGAGLGYADARHNGHAHGSSVAITDEPCSFGIWLKFAPTGSGKGMIVDWVHMDSDGASNNWMQVEQDGDHLEWKAKASGKGPKMVAYDLKANGLLDDDWHRLVVSLDRTDQRMKLWIDGIRRDANDRRLSWTFSGTGSTPQLVIGGAMSHSKEFKGQIGEVIFTKQIGPL